MARLEVLPRVWAGSPRPKEGGGLEGKVREALEAKGKALLWDVVGIKQNRPRLALVRRFEGRGLWVHPGARRAEDVMDCLIAGADRVVVSTGCIESSEELGRVAELTDHLALCFDGEGVRPAVNPHLQLLGPLEVLRRGRALGLRTALVLAAQGPPTSQRFPPVPGDMEVYLGPALPGDARELQSMGARGMVVEWGAPWNS